MSLYIRDAEEAPITQADTVYGTPSAEGVRRASDVCRRCMRRASMCAEDVCRSATGELKGAGAPAHI